MRGVALERSREIFRLRRPHARGVALSGLLAGDAETAEERSAFTLISHLNLWKIPPAKRLIGSPRRGVFQQTPILRISKNLVFLRRFFKREEVVSPTFMGCGHAPPLCPRCSLWLKLLFFVLKIVWYTYSRGWGIQNQPCEKK